MYQLLFRPIRSLFDRPYDDLKPKPVGVEPKLSLLDGNESNENGLLNIGDPLSSDDEPNDGELLVEPYPRYLVAVSGPVTEREEKERNYVNAGFEIQS